MAERGVGTVFVDKVDGEGGPGLCGCLLTELANKGISQVMRSQKISILREGLL